jgi:hypothetical protein
MWPRPVCRKLVLMAKFCSGNMRNEILSSQPHAMRYGPVAESLSCGIWEVGKKTHFAKRRHARLSRITERNQEANEESISTEIQPLDLRPFVGQGLDTISDSQILRLS